MFAECDEQHCAHACVRQQLLSLVPLTAYTTMSACHCACISVQSARDSPTVDMYTQAAEGAAESELADCQSRLRAAEEDCQAADQRMKEVQAHKPDRTPSASGKRASGSAPRAPARSRKRAASEIEDNCASSPSETRQQTRQQQPRTDPLPPRRL